MPFLCAVSHIYMPLIVATIYTYHVLIQTNKHESKNLSLKNKKDLRMACHIPPLKKAQKQGEVPLPSLSPIPSLNSTFYSALD